MPSFHLVSDAARMVPGLPQGLSVVYFLRLKSGQLYIGASANLEERLRNHESGSAGRTTRLDPPLAVLRVEVHVTFTKARAREAQLKRWSHSKKEALIRSDWDQLRWLSRSRE